MWTPRNPWSRARKVVRIAVGSGARARMVRSDHIGARQAAVARGGAHDDALPSRQRRTSIGGGEPRQRAVDEAGVGAGQVRCSQTESSHHPGAEVLDDDIRVPAQIEGRLPTCVLSEIEDDPALATVQVGIRQAREAGTLRWIDMDHVRAVLGQELSEQGPSHVLAEVDDSNSL
jgi:hypothetical protein